MTTKTGRRGLAGLVLVTLVCGPLSLGGTAHAGSRAAGRLGAPAVRTGQAEALRTATWSLQAKLTADDRSVGYNSALAVSGDTAVAGPYVFVRSGTTWSLQATLTAAGSDARFGSAVALSGDTAVIGDYDKNNGRTTGAAYVFVRSGTTWSLQAPLIAFDGGIDDQFGWSVAVSGDTAVVGANFYRGYTGAAYVFVRRSTTWSLQAQLAAADGRQGDSLGWSVAVSGTTALAGAVNAHHTGAAYVFVRRSTTWSQQAELTSTAGYGFAGHAVALSGDTAVLGADANTSNTGAAYVFVRGGTAWSLQATLTAAGQTSDGFGLAVAVSGDTAVIGAQGTHNNFGAAYVFVRRGTTWSQQAELTAFDGQINSAFGQDVAVSGGTAVVSSQQIVGGSLVGDAAYVFVRTGP